LRGALAEVRIEHGQGETNEYNRLPHSHRLDITKPTDSFLPFSGLKLLKG
jgi:hypothetical protein